MIKRVLLLIVICLTSYADNKQEIKSDYTLKSDAIQLISDNLVKYDSLYNSLPDTAIIQKRVLKQVMQNDLMKLIIADKNEAIQSYQTSNAIRWFIGNIGLMVILGVGILFYLNRSKGTVYTAILIGSVVLYLILYNFIPEVIS